MASQAQEKIDAYLAALRRRLRGLGPEEVREVVEELRGHVLEKAAAGGEPTPAGVEAALAALGSPEDLAREYLTDAILVRAEAGRSPLRILDGLFRWATLSVAGFLVLLGTVTGYFLGTIFVLCALLKPIHPRAAGLWIIPDAAGDSVVSLRMGFEGVPAGARDLLGWWIVPLGLLLGCGLLVLTTRFALGCARELHRPPAWNRGRVDRGSGSERRPGCAT